MAKRKKEDAPPVSEDEPTLRSADILLTGVSERILATPDDVLMAWFREGERVAKEMKK